MAHWEKFNYWLFHFLSEFYEINFSVRHVQSQYWTTISILTGQCCELFPNSAAIQMFATLLVTGGKWRKPPKREWKRVKKINPHRMKLLDIHERLLLWDHDTQLMCLLFLHMANDINTLVYYILLFFFHPSTNTPMAHKQSLWSLKNFFIIYSSFRKLI